MGTFGNHQQFNRFIGYEKVEVHGTRLLVSEPSKSKSKFFHITKRGIDIGVSSVLIIFLFPILLLIIGTGIKLTSNGSIFFRQPRTGLKGVEFEILKFRSMILNADCNTKSAEKNDSRVTKFGQLLRLTNLDEIPQIINVFKGEMSLVGPRPYMISETKLYTQRFTNYSERLLVKPGITGLAQMKGHHSGPTNQTKLSERMSCDLYYVRNQTLSLDLIILIGTVRNFITNFWITLSSKKKP
ncbi:MAG: sugar transferase [Cyclobacteriaceae bacterium]